MNIKNIVSIIAIQKSLYGSIVIRLWASILLFVFISSIKPLFAEENKVSTGTKLTIDINKQKKKGGDELLEGRTLTIDVSKEKPVTGGTGVAPLEGSRLTIDISKGKKKGDDELLEGRTLTIDVSKGKPVTGGTGVAPLEGSRLTIDINKQKKKGDDELLEGRKLTIDVSKEKPVTGGTGVALPGKPGVAPTSTKKLPEGRTLKVEVSKPPLHPAVFSVSWWLEQVWPGIGNNIFDPNDPTGGGDTTGKKVEAVELNLPGIGTGFVPLSCIKDGIPSSPEAGCLEKTCPKVPGTDVNHLHGDITVGTIFIPETERMKDTCGHGCIVLKSVGELLLPFRGLCER